MDAGPSEASISRCPDCGTQLAPRALTCPQCRRLVHSKRLKQLAGEAERLQHDNDITGALGCWREALELLPPTSRQSAAIQRRIADLSAQVDRTGPTHNARPPSTSSQPETHASGKRGAQLAGLGAIALLLWKFKFVLTFLATKGKLLLAGLTKGGTFLSMFAAFGVYWGVWGWKFALGLVISIYVHEMGHVAALRRYGIKASAPMFIPGFGALVRLKQNVTNPREDARVGLAGPIWGLAAALVTYGVGLLADWPSWLAIARVAAWINLFNLLPIWQLDGSRGFHALNRAQRWILVAVVAAIWFLTGEGLLLIIGIIALVRAWGPPQTSEPDHTALIQFVVLLVALTGLSMIHVPVEMMGDPSGSPVTATSTAPS